MLTTLAVVVSFGVGWLVGRRSAPVEVVVQSAPRSEGKIRNLVEYRAAVHEAGHAVCAWSNPYTSSIDRVTIDAGALGEGFVLYSSAVSTPASIWYRLVVHLGGLAGESVEFDGRMRSGTARSDLLKAKEDALELVQLESLDPPWPEPAGLEEGDFDMAQMFRSVEAGSPVAVVLSVAFKRAKHVVERDRSRAQAVAAKLAADGVLERADIRAIFGRRSRWLWRR